MTSTRPIAGLSIAAALIVVVPAAAAAQAREPRITLSALATREYVAIENGEGTLGGTGAAVRLRIARYMSVYGEITAGSGEVSDSYEGIFSSIAPQGAPLSEIERLGVVLRRDRTWKAGVGSGFGVAFHTPASQRVGVSLSLGLAGRSLNLTDTRTVLRLPEGFPESRSTGAGSTRSARQRGGPTVAFGMPISVTPRLVIEPELKLTHTVGDEDYTVRSFGVRTGWRF